MSTEENKDVVRRSFEEGTSQGNMSIFDELLAPSYVNHSLPAGVSLSQVIQLFRAAFPDLRVMIEDQLAEGDKVVTRGYSTGTHTGEFQGIPPTGKQVKIPFIEISRVANGKLVKAGLSPISWDSCNSSA
jgi:ketosteroid isomerase-like protein